MTSFKQTRLLSCIVFLYERSMYPFHSFNLSKWIPSLRGRDIEIDRAHRVYDGGRGSDRPRTLIFRVLRWHDRSDILKGARQAYPVKCARHTAIFSRL